MQFIEQRLSNGEINSYPINKRIDLPRRSIHVQDLHIPPGTVFTFRNYISLRTDTKEVVCQFFDLSQNLVGINGNHYGIVALGSQARLPDRSKDLQTFLMQQAFDERATYYKDMRHVYPIFEDEIQYTFSTTSSMGTLHLFLCSALVIPH